ncbi:MAG: hypothetical protein ACI91G_001773 [Gammaproteobacteria bacterium]|jgi:hypothetical protein
MFTNVSAGCVPSFLGAKLGLSKKYAPKAASPTESIQDRTIPVRDEPDLLQRERHD